MSRQVKEAATDLSTKSKQQQKSSFILTISFPLSFRKSMTGGSDTHL